MCGILGSINIQFNEDTLNLINHRGPDFGKIIEFHYDSDIILLGHRRLSIMDLSELGNQPMSTSDGRFHIIFNGEIYNHLDLRDKLKEIEFVSHSDTETILYYLAKFGIEGVKDFNGIFSLAFWDSTSGKLFLIRDPFGVKPLYYFVKNEKIIFSSEVRPIKNLINTTLDIEALAELLKLRYNASTDTIYKEINKILPGHYLEYDLRKKNYKISPYANFIIHKKNITLNQALYQYSELLEKAVKRQLLSDVEVGVLLSGGIDSALITYFAAKNYPRKIKSFTVGFEDKDDSNELIDAHESADFLQTEHHEIIINNKDFENHFDEVIQIIEEPLATTSSIPMYFLNKEVSKYLKVVLTGQGADEPLAGYPRYLGENYRDKIPTKMVVPILGVANSIKNEKIRRLLLSINEKDIIARFQKTYALFSDKEINNLIRHKDNSSYNKINYFFNLVGGSNLKSVDAMMGIDQRMNLADDLLLYTDKISMNFSLETRVPFLDIELIEFLNSLPSEYKIRQGKGKFLQHELAKNILPEKIVNRRKKGFQSPTNLWFKNNLGIFIENLISDNFSYFNQIFNKDEILKILQKHRNGFNQEKQLFLIMSLYFIFQKNFK